MYALMVKKTNELLGLYTSSDEEYSLGTDLNNVWLSSDQEQAKNVLRQTYGYGFGYSSDVPYHSYQPEELQLVNLSWQKA